MNKKILASILACAIAVSTASVAFAADGDEETTPAVGTTFGEITPTVNTESQSAIVDFSVPTTLTVGLDPFQAGDKTGSQVYSESQGIYNKSNIPIRVIVKAGVEIKKDTDGNDKVDLKNTAAGVTSADITNTNKEAYVELVAEKVTATTDRSGAVVLETVKLDGKDYATAYAAATGAATDAKTDLQAVAADGSLTSQISFALQAATYAADRSGTESFSAFAADNKGVASFRFMGSLNANASNWSSDDMAVKVVYDVNGMGTAAYDALIGASAPSTTTATMKAVNVYSVADAASTPSTPSEPAAANATYSLGTGGDLTVTITNPGDYDTVDSISAVGGKLVSATNLVPETSSGAADKDYHVDTTSGLAIVFEEGNSTNGMKSMGDTAAQEVNFTVTLSNSSDGTAPTKTVTFKVTYEA